jgi:hypothetical protein
MTTFDDRPREYRGVVITAYRPFFAHPRMSKANVRFIAKSESFMFWSDSWPKLKAHIDKLLDSGQGREVFPRETDPAD